MKNIGEAGAKAITDALRENSALEELDLTCSNIGHEGFCRLLDALRENRALKELAIDESCVLESQSVNAVAGEDFSVSKTITDEADAIRDAVVAARSEAASAKV